MEWSEVLGIHVMTLEQRLKRMSVEEAFTTKVQGRRFLTYNGETRLLTEWAEILGINPVTLAVRLSNGWSTEKTLGIKVDTRYGRRNQKTDDQ